MLDFLGNHLDSESNHWIQWPAGQRVDRWESNGLPVNFLSFTSPALKCLGNPLAHEKDAKHWISRLFPNMKLQ